MSDEWRPAAVTTHGPWLERLAPAPPVEARPLAAPPEGWHPLAPSWRASHGSCPPALHVLSLQARPRLRAGAARPEAPAQYPWRQGAGQRRLPGAPLASQLASQPASQLPLRLCVLTPWRSWLTVGLRSQGAQPMYCRPCPAPRVARIAGGRVAGGARPLQPRPGSRPGAGHAQVAAHGAGAEWRRQRWLWRRRAYVCGHRAGG